MQIVFINKCKSCEISNQIFFNVIFSIFENERQTCYYINIVKKKVFSGAISHGAFNEPDAYLESSQTSKTERFSIEGVNYFL